MSKLTDIQYNCTQCHDCKYRWKKYTVKSERWWCKNIHVYNDKQCFEYKKDTKP